MNNEVFVLLVGNLRSHAHAAFRVTVDGDRSLRPNIAPIPGRSHRSSINQGLVHGIAYLFNVVLAEGLRSAVDSVLLHLLRHVSVLDDCLSLLRHDRYFCSLQPDNEG